jgi:hypothetical protein
MMGFTAAAVAYTEDEDLAVQALVLAEGSDGSGRRVEAQLSTDITDQDRQAGMDTYALVNEAGATHYGGIVGWAVDGDEVRIDLSPEAAAVLGVQEGYLIQLLDPEAPAVVRDGLHRIVD